MSQVEVLGGSLPPLPPGASGRSGGSRGWIFAALSVLAVALLAVVVWRVAFAAASGATSPEQAVEDLLQGVADQDGVAVLGAVSPGETAGVQAFETALTERLEAAGADPADAVAEGLAIELGDVELSAERLSDHAYRVTVDQAVFTGTSDADGEIEVDLAEAWEVLPGLASMAMVGGMDDGSYSILEEGDAFSSSIELEPGAVTSQEADVEGMVEVPEEELEEYDEYLEDDFGFDMPDPAFIVVQEDGGWHVSMIGTVADVVNAMADGPEPDFEALSAAVTGDRTTAPTPEGAIASLLEAVSSEDVPTVLDALPLSQVGGLYPYAGAIQDSLDAEGVDVELEVTDIATSEVSRDGDLLTLAVDAATVEASYTDEYTDAETSTMTVEGPCVAFDGDESCLPERLTELTGIDGFTVTVREVDGGYQVDPVATLFSYLETAAENVPEDVLLSLLDLGEGAEPQAVDAGVPTTVTLDALGSATLAVEAEAGQAVMVRHDDEVHVMFADAEGDPTFDGSEVSTAWTELTSPSLTARIATTSGTQLVTLSGDDFLSGPAEVEVEVVVDEVPQIALGEEVPLQYGDHGVAEVVGAVQTDTTFLSTGERAVASYCYDGEDCRTLVVATEPGTVVTLEEYSDEELDESYGYEPGFEPEAYGLAGPTFADGATERSFDLTDVEEPADLTVTAAGVVVVEAANEYADLDIELTVLDDAGEEACYSDYNVYTEDGPGMGDEACEFEAEAGRTYTVEVRDYEEQGSADGQVLVTLR